MSATVSERPSGEQPLLRELPRRVRPPMFSRTHKPPLSAEQLDYVANRIRHLDDSGRPYSEGSRRRIEELLGELGTPLAADIMAAAAVPVPLPPADPGASALESMPIGDTAAAEVLGTGPRPDFAPRVPVPVPAPAPDPVPGWPEGVVRGLLIAALWEACRWYGGMDGTGCGDCGALGGLCGFHAPKYDRYWEYVQLHDFTVEAVSDAAALEVVTCSVRAGKADAGDLASPGSHLDLILASVLGTNGGAE